jgi:hypothetical protein
MKKYPQQEATSFSLLMMMICLHWKELMFEQRLRMSQALEVTPSVSVYHHSAKELRTESVLGQPALFQVSHLQSLV